MGKTTVSTKYQIVIPKDVRKKLDISPGMELSIEVIDGDRAVVHTKTVNIVKALQGLGKEAWKTLDGGDRYLKQERNTWDA
ncbi:MAG: AbrB/MazE/SpoVT family DNA-binding domain-containing protein [Candidatus Uhrbacteria bacterium]|nr:AbrB/MazE/SpoVT family DNA-binding domain-containing protein [Candidatus Uhrbacteria bacterium]